MSSAFVRISSPRDNTRTATIANGQSLSGELVTAGHTLMGIFIPATWTAAGLRFYAAKAAGGTYGLVYQDSGTTEYRVAAAQVVAGGYVALDPSIFGGIEFLKIESATTGSAVNQSGARILTAALV